MALPDALTDGSELPLIVAPMTAVSTMAMVRGAREGGVIAGFPTHNLPPGVPLEQAVDEMEATSRDLPPVAWNLVVHRTNARLQTDLDVLVRAKARLVITSVGSPEPVIGPLHEVGATVLVDVASLRHAERALSCGADGLVLLTAGAGGQTGWANPFAFVRAVRSFYTGPLVLAGGIADGAALFAATVLGCDLAYMGTRFIATHESGASQEYREAVVRSSLDDVVLTSSVTGIPTNVIGATLREGIDEPGFRTDRLSQDPKVLSAGHSVTGVAAITSMADAIRLVREEYEAARAES